METMWFKTLTAFLFLLSGILETFSQGPANLTVWTNEDVLIDCREIQNVSGWVTLLMNSPDYVVIYPISERDSGSDYSRYETVDGFSTLTVKNVQTADGATYCCMTGLRQHCANVLVIESLIPSVTPSTGVSVNDVVNLSCSLTYGSPLVDGGTYALSDAQDPQLTIFIGPTELTQLGVKIVGSRSSPHGKTISVNRTIERTDAGNQLVCKVSSTKPQINDTTRVTDLNVRVSPSRLNVTCKNQTVDKNSNKVYNVSDVFICTADGYPPADVYWYTASDLTKPLNGNKRTGYVTWIPKQEGSYNLVCSASNELSTNRTNSTYIIKVGNSQSNPPSGQSTSSGKVGLGVGLGTKIILSAEFQFILVFNAFQAYCVAYLKT